MSGETDLMRVLRRHDPDEGQGHQTDHTVQGSWLSTRAR